MNQTITYGGNRYLVEGLKLLLMAEIKGVLWVICAILSPNNFVAFIFGLLALLTTVTSYQIYRVAKFDKKP